MLDAEGEPTGIKLPYIVTVDEGSRKVFLLEGTMRPAI